jgi:hypothetical protein
MLDEFMKLANVQVMSDVALLRLDPEKLDTNNPEHRELMDKKNALLQRIRHTPESAADKELQRKLRRQMMAEGFVGVPVGVGVGAGLGWGLKKQIHRFPGLVNAIKNNPVLAGAVIGGIGVGGIVAVRALRKAKEQRIQRAYSILES